MQLSIMAIIKAENGQISDKVVILGNMERQKTINSYLNNVEKISEYAGYYTYTGEYNGQKITTVFHGIGIPSMALVVDDLISAGAKKIVRFGSAFSVSENVKPGTAILPIGYSYNFGGVFKQYLGDSYSIALTPDYGMLKAEEEKLSRTGIDKVVGNVFTSDALMTHNKQFAEKLAKDGNIAVELEGAGLYFIAKLKGVQALSVHLAYGNLVTGETLAADKINEKEKKISETLLNLLSQ
ncbi:MAG: hypothetical protein AMDU4_FER2C00028G0053 [Ferroplasma sp. Type II]|nr:MAG: hypothetical protein AMDU4_FER2C00028G0053 [Ferroplasma sp. Type II]